MSIFKKYFTQTIWNRGKQYFLQNKVMIDDYEEHVVYANVYGTEEYTVQIRVDNEELTGYYCDCPASSDGEHLCKHIAAVCMEAENHGILLEDEFCDDIEIKKIRNKFLEDDMYIRKHKEIAFVESIVDYINAMDGSDMKKIDTWIQVIHCVYPIQNMRDDTKYQVLEICYKGMKKLLKESKENVQHISTKFAHLFYQGFSVKDMTEILGGICGKKYALAKYVEMLSYQTSYQEDFIACIIQIKREVVELETLYQALKAYDTLRVVQELKCLVLWNQADKRAKEVFKNIMKMPETVSILTEEEYEALQNAMLDKQMYVAMVEKQLKGWHRSQDVDVIIKLRKMYKEDEWEQEKHNLYEQWQTMVAPDRWIHILMGLHEYELAIEIAFKYKFLYALTDEYFEELHTYDPLLHVNVVMIVLEDYLENAKKRKDYEEIVRCISEFDKYTYGKRMKEEMISYIKKVYPNKKALLEELAYLETEV